MAKNTDKRMVPYGIDLNTIPKDDLDSKAIIPISDARPLAAIPPKPRSYGSSYFVQPVLTAPPQPLQLEGVPPKGPIVKLPARTKILPPKHNETLVGVKTNKSGEIVCAKYSTGERTYFEGVRAHPTKVKFIPPKDAPKHALTAFEVPHKCRKIIDDLEKELEAQRAITTSIEATLRFHGRCILHTNEKVDAIDRRSKKTEDRVDSLEKK
jgi:hypothetical protein